MNKHQPTLYIFFREECFYTIELKDDADAILNAEQNPGTIRVEDAVTRRVIWPVIA